MLKKVLPVAIALAILLTACTQSLSTPPAPSETPNPTIVALQNDAAMNEILTQAQATQGAITSATSTAQAIIAPWSTINNDQYLYTGETVILTLSRTAICAPAPTPVQKGYNSGPIEFDVVISVREDGALFVEPETGKGAALPPTFELPYVTVSITNGGGYCFLIEQ